MVGELSRRVTVILVADLFRDVLDERSAAGHVQHLHPPADREQRELSLERAVS